MKTAFRIDKLLLVGCLWATLSCQLSVLTAQTSDSLADLVNMELTVDVRIFTVLAALNAAGFNYETPGREMSQVRQALRQELQQTDPGLLERLRTFYNGHRLGSDRSADQVAYVSLALLMSGPPDFQLTVNAEDMPADAWQVRGFETLVQEFYQKAGVATLWQRYQPAYSDELTAYRPVLRELIQQTLQYFRIPTRFVLDRKIVLIPDLLNAKTMVNARGLERVYSIVVGPTDNAAENHHQLQHGYLHFLIDPLVEKFGLLLLEHGDLLELAQRQPRLQEQYQNKYFLLVAESLIESILLRLHPPEDPDREVVNLFRQGFIFVPYFQRGLRQYEQTELISFPSYVETLFQDIHPSQIEEDAKTIAALEDELMLEQAEQADNQRRLQEEVDQRNRVSSLLNQAAVLLSNSEYQAASERLASLLEEDPENGNAYFYLAQIASQRDQYEQAFRHYSRAASSPGVPDWVRAWSLARIGNYHAFQGQFGEARTSFDQVLEMEGDLQGAKEEAQESIEQLP